MKIYFYFIHSVFFTVFRYEFISFCLRMFVAAVFSWLFFILVRYSL